MYDFYYNLLFIILLTRSMEQVRSPDEGKGITNIMSERDEIRTSEKKGGKRDTQN